MKVTYAKAAKIPNECNTKTLEKYLKALVLSFKKIEEKGPLSSWEITSGDLPREVNHWLLTVSARREEDAE